MLCLVAEKNVRERQPTNYEFQPSIETGFSCSLVGHLANSSNSLLNFMFNIVSCFSFFLGFLGNQREGLVLVVLFGAMMGSDVGIQVF